MREFLKYCLVAAGILLGIPLHAQNKANVNFLKSYYSVDDGLSQSEVTAIFEDKYGFMWFGTRGGLNRFDGYEFTHFKPEPGGENGLQNPSVESLYPDSKGNIWIGTKSGGISIYNLLKAGFRDPDSLAALFPNRIVAFYEDCWGHYWIGSWGNGVYEYNPRTGEINHYLNTQNVSSILQTQDSVIWLGNSNGLSYKKPGAEELINVSLHPAYHEVTGMVEVPSDSALWLVGWNVGLTKLNYHNMSFERFNLNPGKSFVINTYSLLKDDEQKLWVGTWGNGLFKFDLNSGERSRVSLAPPGEEQSSLKYSIILDIFRDSAGDYWIGTDGEGIVKLSSNIKFRTLSSYNPDIGTSWHVNSVYAGPGDEVWMGIRGGGLVVTKDKVHFEKIPVLLGNRLEEMRMRETIYDLYRDAEGHFWAGLNPSLFVLTRDKKNRRVMIPAAQHFDSPDLAGVRKVLDIEEFHDKLWVATQQDGLYIFSKKNGKYHLEKRYHQRDRFQSLKDNRVTSLAVDQKDNVWIGTYKGLYLKSKKDSTLRDVTGLLKGKKKFLCDIVLSCYIDSMDRVWFGTPCSLNGIFKNEAGDYELKEYTTRDGLTDDYVNAIVEHDGCLWISTNAGISSFNPSKEEFRNYDVSDGISNYNFAEGACDVSGDGTIYFGGYSDLVFFNPEEFEEDYRVPEIAITSFKVMNREVPVNPESILPVAVNEIKHLTFNYRQREFSFEIAALDYKSPENNLYAYRLKDEDGTGEWVYTGRRRHMSFSNLRAGEYTLQLAGSNSNGVWNRPGREIQIRILPPPWKTWYALVVYILVLLGIVTLIIRISLKQERLQNIARIEHMKRMQEHELNEYKLRFFTDISHEFKTPLTLIHGPVEELLNRDVTTMSSSFFKKRINMIHHSAVHLIKLLTQLLEFRKVEAGKDALQASPHKIAGFITEISGGYKNLAAREGIRFSANIRMREQELWFEPSKMEIIVNNLLSNAFKYAGQPGRVELELSDAPGEVLLTVSNDGEKIPEDLLPHLFDRFYQVPGKEHQGGSGIGLYLVKRFVELHKGSIRVENKSGGMTCFEVRFPKGKDHLAENEIAPANDENRKKNEFVAEYPVSHGSGRLPAGVKGSRVLIVEDDEELRDYLTNILNDHFEVMEAKDGLSGYRLATEYLPDLVLSDILMPKMDGFELCDRLKKNEKTSHILVVLLSAKDKDEDRLMGTRKGADAYLTKPFDPALLLETVKQKIAARSSLEKKFRKKITLGPQNIEISSGDEKMIKKVVAIIEKNVQNPHLDSDLVAREVGMSGSTLYRKMKKLVSQTPAEFIKSTKMKIAARYLAETNLTVSEIVERAGYSDLRNFRKNFKSEYGVSPTEYREASKPDSHE